MKEIVYYQKENWKIPVLEFINSLKLNNQKLFSKIYWKIKILWMWLTWNDDIKFIKDKIYELRIKNSSDISRIFYFTYDWKMIILLHWIIKKDNKLNNKEITIALEYKKDFLKRIW